MKTEIYPYDEGYGCGTRMLKHTGMTVNEIIEELQSFADKGYGDTIAFDNFACEPIEKVGLKHFYRNDDDEDMMVVYIE